MSKNLHLTTKRTISFLAFSLCLNFGYSQINLIQNPGADFYSVNNENPDAFDMTPSTSLTDNSGVSIDSPYRFDEDNNPTGWNNTALDAYLKEVSENDKELPGNTADGNYVDGVKTRGLKISSNGRRVYQLVQVTAGKEYTFSVETRAESSETNTEIFMLNTEIETEATVDAGLATEVIGINDDPTTTNPVVDYYIAPSDVNPSKSNATTNNFTTTTFNFTATNNIVVVYIRALGASPDEDDNDVNELFVDNFSLIETSTLSAVDHAFSSKFQLTPNPTTNVFNVVSKESIDSIEVYDMLGKKVNAFVNGSSVDISSLTSGFYIVKVISGNSVAIKRVIKN